MSVRHLLEALGGGARLVSADGGSLEVSLPAQESGRMQESALLRDRVMQSHDVPGAAGPPFDAFLDGVQESRVVAYAGTIPVVHARAGAVVRARINRRLVTWGDAPLLGAAFYLPLRLLGAEVARALDAAGLSFEDTSDDSLDGVAVHPQQMLRRAVHLVQRRRESLERALAERWCAEGPGGLLYVDGGLPASAVILESGRAVGVIKSHHTLYATGDALATVMSLGAGQRSSIFVVETKWREPVASWYLRLRDPRGHDPLWGLARVEVPLPQAGGGDERADALADDVSARVAAESAPLALPDARWDTMAYGIRDCEVFLRAVLGSARS
ncbi:MAG: hypothetical protein ABIZ91_02295 [Gemmatimonadaceae bacterium]